MHTITAQILAQNQGRDPERLALKYAALRADAFAFFRGSNPLFLSQLPRRPMLGAPRVLICGDLHLENFGAYKGDNRLVYFDLNDFDEACLAPLSLDLVRFAASVHVAGSVLKFGRPLVRSLVEDFLDAYAAALGEGKPRWLERSLAEGVFAKLLNRAGARTMRELLDARTRLKDGRRRLRIDKRALPADAAEFARVKRLLRRLKVGGGFYKLLDVARRVAGNGSLGLARDVLLVRAREGGAESLLDLKFAAPSAPAAWLHGGQPRFSSEAERVVSLQRILQAIAPAFLQPVRLAGQPFVLKELQPTTDRLEIGAWVDRPKRLEQSVAGMGRVTAWSQLRACGHLDSASAQVLEKFAASTWQPGLRRLAAMMGERTLEAHAAYAKDYDAGVVADYLKSSLRTVRRRAKRALSTRIPVPSRAARGPRAN